MSTRYAVVDLETTGPKYNRGERIIQIGVVFVEDDQIVDEFSTLIQPLIPIPLHITQLTGITSQDVARAPLFEDIAATLWEKLQGTVFVAHNINFDYKFLSQTFQAAGYPALALPGVDTVEMIRVFYPDAKSYHLGDFCQEYGIELAHAHSANSDARATADVLLMTKAKIQLLPPTLMKQLRPYLTFLIRETGDFIWQWYAERDDHHTLKGWTSGPFTFHVNKKSPTTITKSSEDFEWANATQTIVRQNNGWRLRDDQVKMIEAIHQFLDGEESMGFLSAYAGAGKSLASLYAAWLNKGHCPLVVAVPTNALIDQLTTTTLPQLEALIGQSLTSATLMSRRHFLPLVGFHAMLQFQKQNWGQVSKSAALITMGTLIWIFETKTGRFESLNHGLQQKEYWHRVWTLEEAMAPVASPYRETDFYQHQWQQAKQADIVLTNHAYLIQHWDEWIAAEIFDENSMIIMDECHQLQQTIKSQWAPRLSLSQLQSLLHKTERAIETVENALNFEHPDEPITTQASFYEAGFALEHLFQSLRELLDNLDDNYREAAKKKRAVPAYEQFLSTSAFHAAPWHVALSELWVHGHNLTKALTALFMEIEEYRKATSERALRWQRLSQKWQQMEDVLEEILLVDETSYLAVKAEVKGDQIAHYTLKRTVYQPKTLLEPLWETFPGKWLLMSQVLPIYRAFDQIEQRFGVASYWYREIPAPTHYGETTKAYYFHSEPSIDKRNVSEGAEWIGQSLQQAWHGQRMGRMQVFFQSKQLLQQSEDWLNQHASPSLREHVYAQHEGDYLPKLRQQYEQDSQGILLGLMTMGEGIHFEGETSYYWLTRLPFRSPDQADELAMKDWLTKHHQQYFRDHALPNMLVDLSQWLGRIWRLDERKNILFIFDQRFVSSQYAPLIAKILPPSLTCLPIESTDLLKKSLH
ncbi:MAG: exonuclease domain-containing protein [Aerococcus sp.]|nr:exonuclease domain-containing protein [Aerococcus sp.]